MCGRGETPLGREAKEMLAWLDNWVVQVQENDKRAISEAPTQPSRNRHPVKRIEGWQRPVSRAERLEGSSARYNGTNSVLFASVPASARNEYYTETPGPAPAGQEVDFARGAGYYTNTPGPAPPAQEFDFKTLKSNYTKTPGPAPAAQEVSDPTP
ncbi:hypothetical protein T484DRAFT_1762144, partial [Baffinella frigidus]